MLIILGFGAAWVYGWYSKREDKGGGGNYVRQSQVPGGLPVAQPVRIGTGGTPGAYSGLGHPKSIPYLGTKDPLMGMFPGPGQRPGWFNAFAA